MRQITARRAILPVQVHLATIRCLPKGGDDGLSATPSLHILPGACLVLALSRLPGGANRCQRSGENRHATNVKTNSLPLKPADSATKPLSDSQTPSSVAKDSATPGEKKKEGESKPADDKSSDEILVSFRARTST